MRHPDYDRAFHETPEYIRSAIELGFMKGKKAMKMRYKITSALSVAAALVVILGAAAFGASRLGTPRPDGMLPGRPLSASTATEAPAASDPYATPSPMPADTQIPGTPTPGVDPTPMPTVELTPPPATPEPTAPPVAATEEPMLETVYYTLGGMYFHMDETCSGLQDALAGSVQDAYHAGKEPCPICLTDWNFVVSAVPADAQSGLAESQTVFMFSDDADFRFHLNDVCGTHEDATILSVGAAIELGMTPCPDCLPEEDYMLVAVPSGSAVEAGTEILYATEQGAYCHSELYCSGMEGAHASTVRALAAEPKRLCPVCMTHWSYAILPREDSAAMSEEATAAPTMFAITTNGEEESVVEAVAETAASMSAAYTDIMVSSGEYYYTPNGIYYHINANCSGMRNASAHSLSEAVGAGKVHCPVCIGDDMNLYWQPVPESAEDIVYIGVGNDYYHANPECFGMTSPLAMEMGSVGVGRAACPVCLSSISFVADSPIRYTADGDPHYHSEVSCPSLKGEVTELTEIEAQSEGKIRCMDCVNSEAYEEVIDGSLEDLLGTTFGKSMENAYPGYVFEREEKLDGGIVRWYLSDGDSTLEAFTFKYDESESYVSYLALERSSFAEKLFDRSFLEQLPEPFHTILQKEVNPDSVFQIRVEYNSDGSIAAFGFGSFENTTFSYPRWTINEDGSPEFSGDYTEL